jgi:hypothetical protein
MINAYKVKYHPATDNGGAKLTVTRIDDKKTYRVGYDYGAASAERIAIHKTFGEDTARLEYIGELSSGTHLYAVQH